MLLIADLLRKPEVELGEPVLDGVDGDDAEDGARRRVREQDLDEGDDLHCFAWEKHSKK